MFRTWFKTAVRSFTNNKVFSFINIFGLAIGLTCFVLIAIFIFNELSYDRYSANAKDIYRINLSTIGNGNVAVYPNVDYAVGEGMKNAFPEIKEFARLSPATDFVKYDDRKFKEDKLAFADSNFLQLFSIPLLEGNNKDALVQPNSVVISKTLAKKYFGNADPIGKTLVIGLHDALYTVTGVFDKVPDNSHFHFEAFLSITSWHVTKPSWSNLGLYTYLLLNKNVDPKKLAAKFPVLVAQYVVPEVQHDMGISLAEAQKSVNTFIFSLQPLENIHLYSHTKYEIDPGGDIQYVTIFSVLAVFVLLLACINFTNLSIARSVKRAKEVGIRKVMGSARWQLVKQFLSESVLLSFCAMFVAVLFLFVLLPFFNQLSGKQISIGYLLNYKFLLALIALLFLVGILAGIYPSFFLSGFNPVTVLKGAPGTGRHKSHLRGGLIVFQFFVSTTLIISTLIVYRQLRYMQNKNLGYEKEQVLFLPDGRLMGDNQEAFKQSVLKDSRVVAATIARSVPADNFIDGTEVYPVNEKGNGTEIHMNIYHVDYDYVKTLGIQMQKGRYFSEDFGSDSSAAVVNEAAVKELGWSNTDPIGRTIVRSGRQAFKIVGVMKDFNYTSAKQKVAPLMMLLGGNRGGFVIKIKTADVAGFLAALKEKWNSFNPQGPLNYVFLDEKFAAMYAGEIRTQQIFFVFAIVAIIIASLGLFGLSAFVIEQRTKEIGIHKVLGASVQNVLLLVSKEFLWLIVIAFVISIPVTWWSMHKWLENYAYRINIGLAVFVIGGLAATLIAVLTISYQSIRAATANPVKNLRTE
ncbi:cell division protein FtsX [Niastella koreensis]|uniref:Uncharacterized protein n=2 Tax=Niastella koreensis TaxID=354356 RepID=G8TFR1_NIAKG|nr:ABC transporter permease [Niastella koreensis]AEV99500.1 protein of unknown function DUF214 [Niastella koreensis GR20-10]OQP50092.1 cell division protein FtsX [Niastella koreensis]